MMSRLQGFRILSVSAVFGFAVACGPVETTGLAASDSHSVADLVQIEAQVEGALVGVMLDPGTTSIDRQSALPGPLVRLLEAWAAVPPASCSEVDAGRDVDGDGIPVGFRVVFNCLDVQLAHEGRDALVSVVGTVTLDDADDGVAGRGMRLTAIGLGLRVRNTDGTQVTRTLDGTFVARPSSGGKGLELDRTIRLGLRYGFTEGPTEEATLESSGLLSLDDSAEETTGTYAGTATLTREGRWVPLQRRTDAPLRWRRDCYRKGPAFSGFVAGGYRLEDGRGSVLRVELGACGPATASGFIDCRPVTACAP